MEKSQIQSKLKDPVQEPLSSPKQPLSYYKEVIDSIEKWLNEDDPRMEDTEGNQIDDCNTDPANLTEEGHENKKQQVTKIMDFPNFPNEHYPNQIESCTPIASTSTSHPTKSKRKRRKRRKKSLMHLILGSGSIFG